MGFFEWIGYCVIAVIVASGLEAIGAGITELARAIRDTGDTYEINLSDDEL